MAELKALVHELTIEEHPNADALEFAVIGGYRSIVRKDQYKTGDLAVYIPEQSILPQWLVKELGLEGRLAGKESNRVKAVKLRGVLSQGLIYPVGDDGVVLKPDPYDPGFRGTQVQVGDDVTEFLGIVKYEPPIPTSMSGQVFNASGMTVKYDIENWKNYPDILQEGEDVVFTEKLHGTWACFGLYDQDTYIVGSKGLSAKGLAFKLNDENANNLYVRMYNELGRILVDRLNRVFPGEEKVYILGEIFGKGVQDLGYGMQKPSFRIFDIRIGDDYLDHDLMQDVIANEFNDDEIEVSSVPVLYRGPFSVDVMNEYTNGNETVSGNSMNIREGIVMRPTVERRDDELGRVILKSVSEAYLLRKGGTEFN